MGGKYEHSGGPLGRIGEKMNVRGGGSGTSGHESVGPGKKEK